MDNRREILQLAEILSLAEDEDRSVLKEKIDTGRIDWVALVGVANINLLTPALYDALRRKGLLDRLNDPQLVGFLEEVYRANRDRNLGILEQIEDIRTILQRKRIPFLLLKGGAALTESLYPEIGVRTMNDLDIMMNPQRFDEGLERLKENGYVEFGRDLKRWHHHTPSMDKEGYPAAVEPHFRVIFDRNIEYIPFDETTSMPSRRPRSEGLYVLRPTWHLYHVFLHSAIIDKNHRRWRLGLRYLYDFAILTRKYGDEVDWQEVYRLAKRYDHHRQLEDFAYLSQRLFGVRIPVKTSRMRGEIFLKKCLWESTLVPDTRIQKIHEAYVDFKEIYGYEKLKKFYGLSSRRQYPFALLRYFFYHGRKHLIHNETKSR